MTFCALSSAKGMDIKMTSILILAVICILIGLYAIIKGDMPLIRKKDIRDVKMYARINGAAGIALGIFFISYYFLQFSPVKLFIGLFVIYGITVLAELFTKSV